MFTAHGCPQGADNIWWVGVGVNTGHVKDTSQNCSHFISVCMQWAEYLIQVRLDMNTGVTEWWREVSAPFLFILFKGYCLGVVNTRHSDDTPLYCSLVTMLTGRRVIVFRWYEHWAWQWLTSVPFTLHCVHRKQRVWYVYMMWTLDIAVMHLCSIHSSLCLQEAKCLIMFRWCECWTWQWHTCVVFILAMLTGSRVFDSV